MKRTTILFMCPQDGLTKRPRDPRPICAACKLPMGGITFLWADAEELGNVSRGGPDRDDDP
jgi:hypothetical protein